MSAAMAVTERRRLGAVAAQRLAAPAAPVRLGAVIEPQGALLALAVPDQVEIAVTQQIGDRGSQRREQGLRCTVFCRAGKWN